MYPSAVRISLQLVALIISRTSHNFAGGGTTVCHEMRSSSSEIIFCELFSVEETRHLPHSNVFVGLQQVVGETASESDSIHAPSSR